METIKLKEHIFFTQKDNRNPDGTWNWEKSSEWGRFNQCLMAANTAVLVQNFHQLKSYNVPCKTTGDMEEFAYLLAMKNNIETDKGDFSKEKYYWARHADLMTEIIQGSFGDQFYYEYNTFNGSIDKWKFCLQAGFQFSLGLKLKNVVPGVEGHVVSCSGMVSIGNEVQSLEIQDPAGDANNAITYRKLDYELGESVIYKKDLLVKCIFVGVNSYIVLKVKK